jgi:tetrahydromethanopterin S-methyltransferase subunit A
LVCSGAPKLLVLSGRGVWESNPPSAARAVALVERGVDADRRIVGAIGYEPVLSTLDPARIAQFRQQVEVIDRPGEANR